MFLTAELLLHYQRCHRRAYLDTFGDPDQRDPPNDYLLKLLQDSHEHRLQVLTERTGHRPSYPYGDWETGATATQALMQQGVDCIHQGVLLVELPDGIRLVGSPDLLIRQPGQSEFGSWLYTATDIKLGKRPKLEYQIIAAFHALILAQVQGAWAEAAWLILRGKGLYEVDLWDVLPRMQEILDGCITTLQQSTEPEVFISRSRCGLCHWYNHCYAIAKTDQHLSLLPGVTPTRYLQLQQLNLTSVSALADADPHQLEPLMGFGAEAAHKLVRQASATLEDRAILIPDHAPNALSVRSNGSLGRRSASTGPTLAQWGLPTAPIELYFDIEAEPSLNLVYLHGVLVVDRQTNTDTFYPFLAQSPKEEADVWHQFLELIWQYPDAPIFHFCPYEVHTVQRLAKLYNTPTKRVAPLLTRFVDLHDWITRRITLPVESYALKSIARWLGFEWQDPSANGAQSICWYSDWLTTGDRTYLEAIVAYNEDDCRATHHVKDWLVGFLQDAIAAERA